MGAWKFSRCGDGDGDGGGGGGCGCTTLISPRLSGSTTFTRGVSCVYWP